MFPRGRVYRYPPGRNMGPEGPMPGVAGGMMPPYDMGAPPMREMPGMMQPMPIGTLATALANANPEQQRTVLFIIFKSYIHFHSPNDKSKPFIPISFPKALFKFQIYLVSSQAARK